MPPGEADDARRFVWFVGTNVAHPATPGSRVGHALATTRVR